MVDVHKLFLPEELDELFEGDMPCPGDILLLDGDGLHSIVSRTAQGGSPFSHVGMVVGADLYIDAVLKDGVRVRRIADIALPESGYVPGRCRVARYEDVVKLVKPVWPAALEYYRNPYKLRAVFQHGGKTDDEQEPMICSKLVSEILEDLEIRVGLKDNPLRQPFPKDINTLCVGSKWRRFPLLDYDLFHDPNAVSPSRADFTADSLAQLEALHSLNLGWRALKRIQR